MVASVRHGESVRQVARDAGVSHATVLFWVGRAGGRRLDRVDFADRPAGCHAAANRTAGRLERLVLDLRRTLPKSSDLGEFGAAAIARGQKKGIGKKRG